MKKQFKMALFDEMSLYKKENEMPVYNSTSIPYTFQKTKENY